MKDFLVTVIVPAYNHERYVLECLESIHNQTYRNFLWVVVDDFSKDRTPEILKEHKDRFGYELVLHDRNWGISKTLTETIKTYAKGEYLVLCASDDVLLPNKIELQLKFLQENPQYGMCYSRSIPIDENSVEIKWRDRYKYKSGFIFEEVLCREFSLGIDTMYKTEVLKDVGYYSSNILAEDYYVYSKIAQKYQIGFLDAYLYKYRVTELSKKRDPLDLVMSHKKTVELFKNSEAYSKAIKAWEIKSTLIIASYKKYKIKAARLFINNWKFFICNPYDLLRIIKYLFFIWK